MRIDFCGEILTVPEDQWITIGRDGDIMIDDNPYLHRHFLQVGTVEGVWLLANVGDTLSATVSDARSSVQAWIAPGARLPLVFDHTVVRFTAGPTTYELDLYLDDAPFEPPPLELDHSGDTTVGVVSLTPSQKQLIVALAEPFLKLEARGPVAVPTSAEAAARLGWPLTTFNRKLDNVCQKLSKVGVRGLHGSPGNLATNRRGRLVEYALAVRIVTTDDLSILEDPTRLARG